MAGQTTLLSEIATDKQALNNIFQFLKHQNLKETEEALKKELGISVTAASSVPPGSSCSQPEEVEEAYSRAKYHPRSLSTNVPMDTILIDDDDDDDDSQEEEEEEEEEEEGPRSWPGTFQPQLMFPKDYIKPKPIVPFRTPVLASRPSTLLYKQTTFPTLFTFVPPGLLGSPINPLVSQAQSMLQSVTTTASPGLLGSPINPLVSQAQSMLQSVTTTASPIVSKPSTTPVYTSSNISNLSQKATVTLASIPPEDMTPAHNELKAFAEEFKTKRIQLGYTQGAVGQSLADKGYSNFAQSTISRFEQMQLSPSNAATIMVVLKRWMYEAENPELVTPSVNNADPLGPPRKRKKRVVYTPQSLSVLNSYFQKEPRPNRQIIETVADELDLLPEEVRVWFCNKRQKRKTTNESEDESPYSPRSDTSSPPSPPRTKFTIEELSKSSTGYTNSPLSFSSHLTISPQQIFRPMVFANRGQTVSVTI